MGYALRKSKTEFRLHIRCSNCLRESMRLLEVPAVADAPSDPDELMDSAYLENMPFCCAYCESIIGRLVGIGGGMENV
jgi:hypothetical protein